MGIKIADANEPCDCGSGLKLKDCHLKPSLPKEFFTVKISKRTEDYFVEYVNGIERRIPGKLMMRVSVIDPEHVYPDVIEILNPLREISIDRPIILERFTTIIKELNLEGHHESVLTWPNQINKLQHKLESIKNHMKTFSNHEKKFEEKCKSEYTDSIIEVEELDPIYSDELESFLFQVKSALDIVAQIIGIAFRLSGVVTYGNDGNDLINKLQKSSAFRDKIKDKENLKKIIETHMKWIKNLINMRDLITHYSNLIGFKSTIHSPSSDQNDYVKIYYPSMPNGERVTTYMDDIWHKLVVTINEISDVIKNLNSK